MIILGGDDIRRALMRIACEIVERNAGRKVALVGIHRRGAPLAERLRGLVCERWSGEVALGDIDVASYRDDFAARETPEVIAWDLPFRLEKYTIVLVDDVLYTGRTMHAAIGALFAYGRPLRVQLAVLVDRGDRELPIRPDYVGMYLPSFTPGERVDVRVSEVDGINEVSISMRE